MKRRTGDPASTGGAYARPKAVRDARGLSCTEKCVLFVLCTYADRDAKCYPSVETIALGAALDVGTVRRVLKQLAALGIVQTIMNPKGGTLAGGLGKTSTRRIDFARLAEQADPIADTKNPRAARPYSERKTRTLRDPSPRTAHTNPRAAHNNPRAARSKQTIEPSIEQTRRTDHRDPSDSAARDDGCMDDLGPPKANASTETTETPLHALMECGVRGQYLFRLAAAPELTAAIVRAEYQDVKADPKVDDAAAVLVDRLSKRFEVELKRKGGAIAPDVLDIQKRIEQAQRNSRTK